MRGYLYLPGLLPAAEVAAARRAIGGALEAAGVVAANTASMPMAPVQSGAEADYHLALVKGLDLERHPALHALGESATLQRFFDGLFGEPSLPASWKRIRPIAPGGYSGFHDDSIYMREGSDRLLTAWVPLMPIDLALGGLAVVEGSSSGTDTDARLLREVRSPTPRTPSAVTRVGQSLHFPLRTRSHCAQPARGRRTAHTTWTTPGSAATAPSRKTRRRRCSMAAGWRPPSLRRATSWYSRCALSTCALAFHSIAAHLLSVR